MQLERGDPAAAGRLYTEALEIFAAAFGGVEVEVANLLRNVATARRSAGDLEGCEAFLRDALTLYRELQVGVHEGAATGLNELAVLLEARGELTEAEQLYREALAMYRELHGERHPNVAAALNNLAGALLARGDYEGAVEHYRKTLSIDRELLGSQHPYVALGLKNLGAALHRQGRLEDAAATHREALELARASLDPAHPMVAGILNNLAVTLGKLGRFEEAERLFGEALELLRRRYGEEHPDVAVTLSALGELLGQRGRYGEAEALLRRALAMRRAFHGEHHREVAVDLGLLGQILRMKGDLAGAEPLYRRSLALLEAELGPRHPEVGNQRERLATLLSLTGREPEAEALYEELLEARREDLGETHPSVAITLNNLGLLLRNTGRYELAEERLAEALELLVAARGRENPQVADLLSNQADLALARGDRRRAEELHREVLAMDQRLLGEEHPAVGRTYFQLGGVALAGGELEEAAELFGEALRRAEAHRTRVLGTDRERALFAEELRHSRIAADLARTLIGLGRHAEALEVAERGKARVLLDMLARSGPAPHAAGEEGQLDELLLREASARAALAGSENQLAAAWRSDAGEREPARIDALLRELALAREELSDVEARVSAELRDRWPDAQAAPAGEILNALEEDEALALYSWTGSHVSLLWIPPGGESVRGTLVAKDAAAERRLAADVAAWRARLAVDPRARAGGPDPDREELLATLLPPAARTELESAARLVLVPDGPLHGISFDALQDAGPPIVRAPSASAYLNRRAAAPRAVEAAAAPKPASAVVLGDPRFIPPEEGAPDSTRGTGSAPGSGAEQGAAAEPGSSPEPGSNRESERASGSALASPPAALSALERMRLFGGARELRRLPSSGAEARHIAELLDDSGCRVSLLVGPDASLPRLEEVARGARFLHIATHGFAGTRTRPDDACLALAQPATATAADPGFLSLDRLLRDWGGALEGCRLVVLSACDTQSRATTQDSSMALPWGFFYAGAPTVVASLWRVDDRATALLMARFYENLLGRGGEPLPPAAALDEAKRWLRLARRREIRERVRELGLDRPESGGRGGEEPAPRVNPAELRPYADPYFWAAFVLIGDPG